MPDALVKEFVLQAGMEVVASVDPRGGSFVVRMGVKFFDAGEASPRFRKMVDQLVKERRELYERLANGTDPDDGTPAPDTADYRASE